MRRLNAPHTSFGVEISALAWQQMGTLSEKDYDFVREKLNVIAELATLAPFLAQPRLDGEDRSCCSFLTQTHVAVYEVDVGRKRVVLRELARRPSLARGS